MEQSTNPQTLPDEELQFSSCIRSLSMAEKVALLLKMRDCLGQPEPVRVWCVVQETGGCVVWANGEAGRV